MFVGEEQQQRRGLELNKVKKNKRISKRFAQYNQSKNE